MPGPAVRPIAVICLAVGLLTAPLAAKAGPEDTGDMIVKTDAGIDAPEGMPTMGSRDALVTIIEISEFQCPFCSRVQPTVQRIMQQYDGRVRFIWANNPLGFHSRAMPAAVAALAAHRQGQFWAMHDRMFANQRKLTEANFSLWASEIGLDLDQWRADRRDRQLADQVTREQRIANALGARGTPSFLINGKRLSGAQPLKKFAQEIDAALTVAARHAGSGKTGFDLIVASWTETGGPTGAKAADYFLAGAEPPATAPKAPAAARRPANVHDKFTWYAPVARRDQVAGDSRKALVTIVEFSDLQCPYCSRAANTLEQVRKHYGDKVRVVAKHYPLPFHTKAMPAHQAAVAAGKQGKFWAYRAKAFANQRALDDDNLRQWARGLGLDMRRFERDRNSAATARHIADDMALAKRLGIRGTPSFLVNGRFVRGAQPLANFKKIVDEEVLKARATGKRGRRLYKSLMAQARRKL